MHNHYPWVAWNARLQKGSFSTFACVIAVSFGQFNQDARCSHVANSVIVVCSRKCNTKKRFYFFSRVTFKTDQHKQLAYVFFFCKQQWTTSWAIGRSMACQCSQQTECFNFHFGIYSFFHPTAVCRFRSFHHGMHQNMFRVGHAFMTINKNIGRKTWFNLVIVGFFS